MIRAGQEEMVECAVDELRQEAERGSAVEMEMEMEMVAYLRDCTSNCVAMYGEGKYIMKDVEVVVHFLPCQFATVTGALRASHRFPPYLSGVLYL